LKVELAYGSTGLTVQLPDDAEIDIIRSRYKAGYEDQRAAVHRALISPVSAPPLSKVVKPKTKVGIVVSDVTRPVPYKYIIPEILQEVSALPNDIWIFIATGTHRKTSEEELKKMLGEEVLRTYRIVQNNASARGLHSFVGTTKRRNHIYIHRDFLRCDVKILTGFIEPHFFAGFSGGGKAVMPGLASLETILNNHSPHNIDSPRAGWGITRGNPVWEDIQEAARLVGPTFLINVTLNRNREITGVFAGDFMEAYDRGCAAAMEIAMPPARRLYDIVITSNAGYPLDLNMYQSVKGMSAACLIVRDGGSIIVAAECRDGIPDTGMYQELLMNAKSPDSLLKKLHSEGFRCQDMWEAQIHARICKKADVYFYSDNLKDDDITGAFMTPCSSVEETIESLLKKYGKETSICVLPEGPLTIPGIDTGL